MKIGFVIDDTLDRRDGVQAAITVLGKELSRRGHEVHYITTTTTQHDISNVHSLARSTSLKFNGNSVRTPLPVSRRKIQRFLEKEQFDILHVQMPHSPLFASRIVMSADKQTKIIGTFHILPFNTLSVVGMHVLGFFQSFFSVKKINALLAVSKPAQQFARSVYGRAGTVLPNPVNVRFYKKYRVPSTKQHGFAFVGRFDERKGVMQLLEAYRHYVVRHADKPEPLVLCGKGPLLDKVKHYIEKHQLPVLLPGFVSEQQKAQYLAQAKVAVFPSVAGESFGIVLAESMAAGAGVTLAGNNPGYSSVLASFPQVLFNPNDTTQFSKLLFDAAHTKNFSTIAKAQHKYAESFDVEYIADKLLYFYNKG